MVSLDDGWSLVAAYTHQRVKIEKGIVGAEGKELSATPNDIASLWVHYDIADGALDGLGLGAGLGLGLAMKDGSMLTGQAAWAAQYGDWTAAGALAAKAPSMKDLRMAADKGIPIVGICNGFQILCEMNLLPGVLMKNRDGKFIDEWVDLEVCSESPYSSAKKVRYPIAHGDGRYFVTNEELKNLQDQDQVWLRYFDNPNGSTFDIAGVKTKNVFGLMPHPERALFDWMGGSDGQSFFEGFLK